jgi:hypothetical protein
MFSPHAAYPLSLSELRLLEASAPVVVSVFFTGYFSRNQPMVATFGLGARLLLFITIFAYALMLGQFRAF